MMRSLSLSLVVIALGSPQGATGQGHTHDQPDWVADVGVAGANIVVGALTSAATAAIRGEDVAEAFLKGAAGGGVVFAGKRLAVARFSGAGLLGRQVASVGTGMVVDGGHGRDWFDEVWLPIGPLWLQARPGAGRRARVSLRDMGAVIWAATRPELRFDLGRSLSNGAPAFVADRHRIVRDAGHADAFTVGGVVVLGVTGFDLQPHENIHVIQNDYLLQTLDRPFEQWGWGRLIDRSVPVDLGVLILLPGLLLSDLKEAEAEVLHLR